MKEYVVDVIEISDWGEIHHKKQVRVESDKKGIKQILADAIAKGKLEDNDYA